MFFKNVRAFCPIRRRVFVEEGVCWFEVIGEVTEKEFRRIRKSACTSVRYFGRFGGIAYLRRR